MAPSRTREKYCQPYMGVKDKNYVWFSTTSVCLIVVTAHFRPFFAIYVH
jgi:hypothetical protein